MPAVKTGQVPTHITTQTMVDELSNLSRELEGFRIGRARMDPVVLRVLQLLVANTHLLSVKVRTLEYELKTFYQRK
jgi:hypothetical protein